MEKIKVIFWFINQLFWKAIKYLQVIVMLLVLIVISPFIKKKRFDLLSKTIVEVMNWR